MVRNYTDEQLNEVADHLMGTCLYQRSAFERLFGENAPEMTIDDAGIFDGLAFECDTCGWWMHPSELSSNLECDDCAREEPTDDEEYEHEDDDDSL